MNFNFRDLSPLQILAAMSRQGLVLWIWDVQELRKQKLKTSWNATTYVCQSKFGFFKSYYKPFVFNDFEQTATLITLQGFKNGNKEQFCSQTLLSLTNLDLKHQFPKQIFGQPT